MTDKTLSRAELQTEFDQLLRRRRLNPGYQPDTTLRDIGFRSLDFSELALRIEERIGRELNFDAAILRNVRTAEDVFRFFEIAQLPDAG